MKLKETSKVVRSVEAFLEVVGRILGMLIVYLAFKHLLVCFGASVESQDLLVSMLLLPSLYILKDLYKVIEPATVRIEFHAKKITVLRGFSPRVKDTLEFKNSENIEVITTILGRFFDYGTVVVYSPGGNVEIPFVFKPDEVVEEIENAK